MGECGSAKEIVLAVQECLERLDFVLRSDADEETSPKENLTPSDQLISLISLYSSGRHRLHSSESSQ
jgi:hypothetical protein